MPLSRASFESELKAHLDAMYRYGLRLTRDSVAAQDLVQDSALRALKFYKKYDPARSFKAWILTLEYRLFVQQYRHRKVQREYAARTQAEMQDRAHLPSAEEAERITRMDAERLLGLVDQLSEDQRAVVALCDIEGLSYKECSEVLEVPIGTIMSRLHRGRARLRDLVGREQRSADAKVVEFARYAEGRGGKA